MAFVEGGVEGIQKALLSPGEKQWERRTRRGLRWSWRYACAVDAGVRTLFLVFEKGKKVKML